MLTTQLVARQLRIGFHIPGKGNGKARGCALLIVFCIAACTLRTMQLSLATQASIFSEDSRETQPMAGLLIDIGTEKPK